MRLFKNRYCGWLWEKHMISLLWPHEAQISCHTHYKIIQFQVPGMLHKCYQIIWKKIFLGSGLKLVTLCFIKSLSPKFWALIGRWKSYFLDLDLLSLCPSSAYRYTYLWRKEERGLKKTRAIKQERKKGVKGRREEERTGFPVISLFRWYDFPKNKFNSLEKKIRLYLRLRSEY